MLVRRGGGGEALIEGALIYLNCVGLQVRKTQPSLGCSSEASPQSLSPSQTYDIMTHLEVFSHLNSVGSHVRWLQAWSAVASSEPSPQSSSPSQTNFVVMQRPKERQNNSACVFWQIHVFTKYIFCGLVQSHELKTTLPSSSSILDFLPSFFLKGERIFGS